MIRRGRHVQRGLVSSSIANGLPPPESQLHTHTRWHRPSSSLSSLAREDDDGSDVHCCSCRHVVVDWLSCWLSCCCCFRPESSLLPPPPLPPPNHQRAVAVAIATTTSIAAAVAIAFAAAITAALASLPLSPPSSTRLSPRRRIEDAHSLNVAIASYRHFRGHRRRHCHCRCCWRL